MSGLQTQMCSVQLTDALLYNSLALRFSKFKHLTFHCNLEQLKCEIAQCSSNFEKITDHPFVFGHLNLGQFASKDSVLVEFKCSSTVDALHFHFAAVLGFVLLMFTTVSMHISGKM